MVGYGFTDPACASKSRPTSCHTDGTRRFKKASMIAASECHSDMTINALAWLCFDSNAGTPIITHGDSGGGVFVVTQGTPILVGFIVFGFDRKRVSLAKQLSYDVIFLMDAAKANGDLPR
jgi:hypothetical protein